MRVEVVSAPRPRPTTARIIGNPTPLAHRDNTPQRDAWRIACLQVEEPGDLACAVIVAADCGVSECCECCERPGDPSEANRRSGLGRKPGGTS